MSGEERISSFYKNDRYYAHLSIYHFASQWCADKIVLDAGCGSGYGTNYLARSGARKVWGVDADRKTVLLNQKNLTSDRVAFLAAGLSNSTIFPAHSFDVILASNSLEHVEKIYRFFRNAWMWLKPDGILLVAVPAVHDLRGVAEELSNPFHLNIWSDHQWHYVIKRYMNQIRCFSHTFARQDLSFQPRNTPAQTKIKETDFSFREVSLEALCQTATYTSVFVALEPVREECLPSEKESLPILDFSVSRRMKPRAIRTLVWLFYRVKYVLKYEGYRALLGRIRKYKLRSFESARESAHCSSLKELTTEPRRIQRK